MKNYNPVSRRLFFKRIGYAGAILTAPMIIHSRALAKEGIVSPNERVCVALIGCGLMGKGHLRRLAGDNAFELIAVCDVDKVRRDEALDIVNAIYASKRAKNTNSGCKAYNDYREILIRTDIDAVVIVTPDHWHSLISVEAAKAGKDIYCEKPVSLTVREGRIMADAIKRHSRVFQTGTQYRSTPVIRQVCEFVRSGGLGEQVRAFTLLDKLMGFLAAERFKPYTKYIERETKGLLYYPAEFALPAEEPPEGLDWNLWVGPADWHPYNKLYHINPSPGVVPWSFCEAFGAAANTWYLSHSADVIQYALGVERSGPVEIIHPSDGLFPTLTFRYANGCLLHFVDHWGMVKDLYNAVPKDARLAGNFGGVFVGKNGWITSMSIGGPIEGGPSSIFDKVKLKTREVNVGTNNHHSNWLDCIRTRGSPSADEEIGHRAASVGHLAMISYKLGRSLKWNPVKEEFVGDAEANRLLSKPFREPYRF
ncbi:MAG: Gfo/Idh/MocA family protein [Verrucomicrobiia bacterium]